MINKSVVLTIIVICAGLSVSAEPPADETDLEIYKKVIEIARRSSFDGLALMDPVMLVRHSHPERFGRYGRRGIAELPSKFAEAYEALRSRKDSVDLGALAGAGIAVSDTLDKSWRHCNVMFSQIGYTSAGDAAAVLFTYGCRRDTLDFRRSYMVFLSRESDGWKITNYVDTMAKQGDPTGRLLEYFYYRPWEVPRETYAVAKEYLYSGNTLEQIFGRSDTTLEQLDRLDLGTPWGIYTMTDSCFELFSSQVDPDPRQYDQHAEQGSHYNFPIMLDGTLHGNFTVGFQRYFGYHARGVSVGNPISVDMSRMLRRLDVRELLGQINIDLFQKYWAWRDTARTFRLSEIATFASAARYADCVVIGRLKNKRSRALTIIHAADSLRGRNERTVYYDVGDLDVEKVLKGPYSTTYLTVGFASDRPSNENLSPLYDPVGVENGDKRIWILSSLSEALSPLYLYAPSGKYVLDMEHLDAVMEYLPDPPPPMGECPMTRGELWNAELKGEKGRTVFFVLGALKEYMCRRFVEDSDKVERFYCNEQDVAAIFYRYLERLSYEQGLDADIKKAVRQECLWIYHSPILSAFINSFYDYKLTTSATTETDEGKKMMGHACLKMDVFEGLEREMKLAYLAGAYYRWGDGDSFRFANASKKADLIRDLLDELGCTAERSWKEGIPATNWVHFKPTEELSSWFDKMPEKN